MSVLLWLAGGFLFVLAFVMALCKAAADGDLLRPQDEDPANADYRLAEVIPMRPVAIQRRARTRRDVRNGLDGAA